MTELIINNRHRHYGPDCWDELTAQQLLAIAPLLCKNKLTLAERTSIALTLFNIGNRYYTVKSSLTPNGYEYFANEVYDNLLPAINFLFTKNTLTRQLLPVVQIPGKYFFTRIKLYGPQTNFANLTISEFSDAEFCLEQYNQTKDPLWQNRFLACLYRPACYVPHQPENIREPYNFFRVDEWLPLCNRISDSAKCAITVWYMGCRQQLADDFGFLFHQSKKEAAEGGSTLADIIHGMAGGKFGTYDQTAAQYVRIIFHELQLQHKKNNA